MTPTRYKDFAKYAVAFDTETHLSQPGLMAPPLVCGSIALVPDPSVQAVPGQPHPGISGELLDKEAALQALLTLLEDEDRIIVGAHIAYDFLVCATEFARRGRDILPLIFRAYEQGRVYDILIGEALGACADGCLGKDPRTGGDLRNPRTGRDQKYYSLEIVTDLVLNRVDAKANDEWRLKYYLLEGIPIQDWPPAARHYPVDDVRNTLECALGQLGLAPKRAKHRWIEREGKAVCSRCGELAASGTGSTCWVTQKHRNLHAMADQAYTAWCLHLGAAWGFNVDQDSVDRVVSEVEAVREKTSGTLLTHGLLKWVKDGGELRLGHSKGAIARAVAEAYGASGTCSACGGVGRVPKPGKPLPKKRAYDPAKDGNGCKECCETGFDLSTAPYLTLTDPSTMYPKGQVSADRDTLNESGSDLLRVLADYDEDAKTITNYGPYLRTAQVTVVGGDGVKIRFPRPLNLRPNVFLETDRVSYGEAIQQFPRAPGYYVEDADGTRRYIPSLRECIVARKGYVLCSCDYNQGEVITHAQSLIWILGESEQARLVLAGQELHSAFGAQVLNVDYDEFFKNKKKNKSYANARQAAKPWIFGKPGGMGVPKLVATQRKQGPDTPCENGPVDIDDGTGSGNTVRGYKGLRFCILMEGATRCGGPGNMSYSWGNGEYARPIKPTCTRCLECAAKLEAEYYRKFPEARKYFNFTGHVVEHGQPLFPYQAQLHDLPPGSSTAPGEMIQHVSAIIRGDVGFNDCSNGYFQSLLAVAAKLALRRAQRECCDVTYKVPTDKCVGGKVSAYAGKRSPLFGSRCIVLQHDELIAEIPERNQHHGSKRLSEIMIRALQEVCPDMAAIIKAPPALMLRWFKAAEPVYHCPACGKKGEKETCCPGVEPLLVPWTMEQKAA